MHTQMFYVDIFTSTVNSISQLLRLDSFFSSSWQHDQAMLHDRDVILWLFMHLIEKSVACDMVIDGAACILSV